MSFVLFLIVPTVKMNVSSCATLLLYLVSGCRKFQNTNLLDPVLSEAALIRSVNAFFVTAWAASL